MSTGTKSLPKWAERFLQLICPQNLYEEIEGDLIQRFQADIKRYGQRRANRRLFLSTLRYVRPGIVLRNKFSVSTLSFDMFRHFILTFFRSTTRNAGYSFINVFGLSLGILCFIFIALWVVDELTYDNFHENRENIYQVMSRHTYPDGTFVDSGTPGPLAGALSGLSGVIKSCRVTFQGGKVLFKYNDKSLYENGIYADPSFLEIFTLNVVHGDPKKALDDPASIIISKTLATKYFGSELALGQVISINSTRQVTVAAVFEPLPRNSTLQFDYVLPYALYSNNDQYNNEWGAWTGGFTYLKIAGGSSITQLEKQIHAKFTKPNIWVRWDTNVDLFLFPMKDWHLYSKFTNGVQDGGKIDQVKIFSLVAFFILGIAAINFTNLATARALKRAKEIGVRKVIGARKHSLFFQFIFESLIVTGMAMMLALIAVGVTLPAFNSLTGKHIAIPFDKLWFYGRLLSIWIITTLMAGSYPAIVLSAFRGLDALKVKSFATKGLGLRKGLVVFQFAISVTLIVCALMAYEQIEYIRSKDLGFDKNQVIYFGASPALSKKLESFKHDVLQNPDIKSVAEADANPADVQTGMVLADNAWPGKTKDDNIVFRWMQCDEDFLATLGFKLIEGRWFSKGNVFDSVNYVVNEEAVRQMKLKDPIDQPLSAPHAGKIIGVVKDFHSCRLQFNIQPVIIAMKPVRGPIVFVKYEKATENEIIPFLADVHRKYAEFPFEWKMMDDGLTAQYENELLIKNLTVCFTVIAIIISCLGLVGLSDYLTENRMKEIGIRKVVGASVIEIVNLLSKDFLLLVLIALLIGSSIGWFVGEQYLKEYAFRFEMNAWIFVWTIVALIVMTLLAVSYQSVKAALSNPVKTLKAE